MFEEDRSCCQKMCRKAVISACCVFAFSMALPAVYFISALLNESDEGFHASRISQMEGSPCANFQKIDSAWALLISAAALGTACALLQAYLLYRGGKSKLSKVWTFLSLGPFICSCMIVDIWTNIPEKCQEMLENNFDNEVALWTGIQVVVYAFIVGMSCMGLMCCCTCFAVCGGYEVSEMMFMASMKVADFGDSDDDFDMPEMFSNPAAFEAKMEKMKQDMEGAMKQIKQMEQDAANGDPEAQAKMNNMNALFGGKKIEV